MKAYHVAPADHQGDLLSLYEQEGEEAYDVYAERWPDAGELAQYHVHQVHLYSSLEEAQNHVHDGKIYEVDCSEIEVYIDDLEFPHPVVDGQIDAEYLTKI